MLPIWKPQTFSRKESSLLWTEHRVSTHCACLSVELKLQQWVAISLLRSRVSLAEIEHALYRARGVLLFNRGRRSGLLCLFTLSWTSYSGSLSPQFRRDTVLPERLLQLSATDTLSPAWEKLAENWGPGSLKPLICTELAVVTDIWQQLKIYLFIVAGSAIIAEILM